LERVYLKSHFFIKSTLNSSRLARCSGNSKPFRHFTNDKERSKWLVISVSPGNERDLALAGVWITDTVPQVHPKSMAIWLS
jgi:hypothetical protein